MVRRGFAFFSETGKSEFSLIKGEAVLTVVLGTHTFLKVKAETVIRQEGEVE